MGRINKALERLKNQGSNNTKPRTSTQNDVRTLSIGNSDDESTDVFDGTLRKVKFDKTVLRSQKIITQLSDPAVLTSYKMLRTRILQRMNSNGWRHLAITSATQGDGKTVTAINLALSLAGDVNHQVCLVDLDLRRSSVAKYLGLKVERGTSDCLQRGVELQEALVATELERLVILPNHRIEEHSSEALSSPRMHEIADQLGRKKNRIVIYDMPPVLAADDMLAFSPICDAILLVVAEGETSRTDVMKAHEILEGAEIIGTVLNRSDEKTASYY